MDSKTTGTIDKVIYHDQESGYSVLSLVTESKKRVTTVGTFNHPYEGMTIEAEGQWVDHPKFGKQFKVSSWNSNAPASKEEIFQFLGSGAFRGMRKQIAHKIVNVFAEKSLEIIEKEPHRLLEIPGIGSATVDKITSSYRQNKHLTKVVMFLQRCGIGYSKSKKIFRRYGKETLNVIQRNPYVLVSDVWGIGFALADKIAVSAGIELDDPMRVQAGLVHSLLQAKFQGHVFLPEWELFRDTKKVLKLDPSIFPQGVRALVRKKEVVVEDDRIFLHELHHMESQLAIDLFRLMRAPRS